MEGQISKADKTTLWLSLIIPGVITALVDFDVSIFVTYAVAASVLGSKTMWLLVLVYGIVHVLNSVSGRIVIVADKGLIELIREYFGISVSLSVFITMYVLDLLVVLQSFLALHFIADLFKFSFVTFSVIFSIYLFIIFLFKIQKFTNRVFILIALFYFSVVIHAVTVVPEILNNVVTSKLAFMDFFHGNTSLYFLALLGATASAWNQLLVTRYTFRTKLDLDKLEYHALDNRTATLTTLIYGMMFVSVIAVLFPGGELLQNPTSFVRFIPALPSLLRMYFFAFGLLFIALTNIYAVTLSLSHAFSEFFGLERNDEEEKKFMTAQSISFLSLVIPAVFIANITQIQFIPTAIMLGYIQFLFIFVLLYFLYYFSNHEFMGRYRNEITHNIMLWGITLFLGAIFLDVFIRMIFNR